MKRKMTNILTNASFFESLFKYEFLQYALITGIIIGFLAPLIGSFVVIRRLSFIADTLSHFSLAGLSIGLYIIHVLGYTFISDPIYLGIIFSVIGAIFIEYLRGIYSNYKEISMPIVLSLGTALSAIFISLGEDYSSLVFNYLFGSILTVTFDFVILILIVSIIVVVLIVVFYREMVIISFDQSYARLLGIKVRSFQLITTLILAVVVSLSIETVGVLLVSSLMIIPVAAAMKVGKSFKNTLFIAIMFSEVSTIGGLWASYHINIPSGATIVLINIMILLIVVFYKRIFTRKNLAKKQSEIILNEKMK